MSWTDERVSRLTKLWQEGLSASQIAADLGGVTRNAVIGKVHRLGMSNRDKPAGTGGKKAAAEKAAPSARRKSDARRATPASQPAGQVAGQAAGRPTVQSPGHSSGQAPGPSKAQPAAASAASASFARTAQRSGVGATMGNAALKMELEEDVAPAPAPEQDADDVVIPISRKLTLLQLTENTCKWPTGDPTMPGFSFCGHQTAEDKPYCEHHAKVAFQPPSERRRRR